MKAVLVNYNFTPTWLLTSGLDYVIYDRSDSKDFLKDFDQSKIIYTENIGQVDLDKLSYLIDHYDSLPDVFLWGKTNLFKYITESEYEEVKDNQDFTPLLTKNHAEVMGPWGAESYYSGGIYYERSNMLYFSDWKYFKNYPSFAHGIGISSDYYVPFAPGGNYILTRERVHRYSRDFYARIKSFLPYAINPVEAHFAERCYYTIWR